jgi:tetratricopeptide (TPR) repeat protein
MLLFVTFLAITTQAMTDAEQKELHYFASVLEKDPNNSIINYHMGEALYYLAKYEEAIPYFEKALAVDQDMDTLNMKAMTHNQLQQYQLEIDTINLALEIDSECVAFYHSKANALAKLDKPDEALKCIDHALEFDGYPFTSLYLKGCLLQDLGKHAEAIKSFDKALKKTKNPNEVQLAQEKKQISVDLM